MDIPGLHREGRRWQLTAETADRLAALSTGPRHAAFHHLAKAVFRADGPARNPAQGGDLVDKGFFLAPRILPPDICATLSARIGEWLERDSGGEQNKTPEFDFRRDDSNRVVSIDREVVSTVMPVVHRILRRQIVATCEAFLESYFKLNSIRLFRTLPVRDALVSFRWHVDAAPPGQIHILVYLTDAGPDGINGCTSFLPRPYYDQLNASGYAYGAIDDRVQDLAQIEGGAALADKVETPSMAEA